jgi:hypothetical protein
VVAELEAVGLTPGEPEEAELGAGEPEALEQEAAEPAASGDPAAEEPAAEELAADAGPLATQPAVGQGYWQTQRAGQRPARSTRNPTPSYTSGANVAEVVSLDAALQNRAETQIGEQLEKEVGERSGDQTGVQLEEQGEQKNVHRERRPGSRRLQRQRASRRRRQRATQCTKLMPQAHSAGATQAVINSGGCRWQVADQAEIEGILDLGTWEAGGCLLPEGKQPLPTHFVREVKRDGRYKSRLVAGSL